MTIQAVSNYFPIKAAMGKNLRSSLDLNRRQKDEVGVVATKLEDVGMDVNQMIVAIMLVVIGFVTYYLIPWSFYEQQQILMFMLLNLLLILIIVGLTFICVLLFRIVESILLWIVMHSCCWRDRRLYTVVVKNMEGHQKRNSKTSVMFTLSISFLIFAASSFTLISTLISKTYESLLGADIMAQGTTDGNNFLNEIPIANFLDNQKMAEGNPVLDYAFASYNLKDIMSNSGYSFYFTGIAGFHTYDTKVHAVPENFLNVTDVEFYVPTSIEGGFSETNTTIDGNKIDAIGLLYSEENEDYYPSYPDDDQDYYNVTVFSDDGDPYKPTGPTWSLNTILPSGMRNALNCKRAGELINFQMHGNSYQSKVRAFTKKFPGFLFSDFKAITLNPTALISIPQYVKIMDYWFGQNPDDYDQYISTIGDYQFKDNIIKTHLFIKLNPDITPLKRDFVANGVRSFFTSKETVLFTKSQVTDTLKSTGTIFNIFVAIIACIALTISFFLLLVSTTQNVTDAIWEYGVLRSMGITRAEGRRIFFYESFIVVASAAILGTLVGMVTATIIAAQFYMFLELPVQVFVPWTLLIIMLVISILTTFLAVVIPVGQVNRRQIASVLKAGA